MKRNLQLLLSLNGQLNKELEKQRDFFFARRPFLLHPGMEPEILPRTDEQIIAEIENQTAIEMIAKKIKEIQIL